MSISKAQMKHEASAHILSHKEAFQSSVKVISSRNLRVATLGPSGTSSNLAAEFFSGRYPARIVLFDTYEEAADFVSQSPYDSVLIVANAYNLINNFYISDVLRPSMAFFQDTPPYVIVAKTRDVLERKSIIASSHPAPAHLILKTFPNKNTKIKHTESTYKAAQYVLDGKAEICLTTRIIATELKLIEIQTVSLGIPMLWTIFISKECR